MPSPRSISGLNQIAHEFDGVLCDVWGVLHNGRTKFPEAVDALYRFKEQRCGPVVLITNAPRPPHEIQAHLDSMELPRDCYDGIVSSGGVVQADLQGLNHAKIYHIGPEKNRGLFHGVNYEFVAADKADIIVCSGLNDRSVEEPEDYREPFKKLLELNLPMLCANPDIVAEQGNKLVWCGGALAKLYEEMGGETIITGKPHRPIYNSALAELQRLSDKPLEHTRILTIGDGIPTDIKGAHAMGLPALFLSDGIHAEELSGKSQAIVEALDKEGLAVHSYMGR